MGLYIKVRTPKVSWYPGLPMEEYRESLYKATETLLGIAEQTLHSWRPILKLIRAEIWHNAPSKSEGGKLLNTSNSLKDLKLQSHFKNDPFSNFIVLDLKFSFDDFEKLGYLRINPIVGPWKDVYGNIMMNIYDLEMGDLFLSYPKVRECFKSTIHNLKGYYEEFVDDIIVGWGIESLKDLRYRIAIHKRREETLLREILDVLKKVDPQKYEDLQPYSRKFLISKTWEEHGFHEKLRIVVKNAEMKLSGKRSIALEGERKNSFERFYDLMVKEIFNPLLKEIPSKRQILDAIAKAMKPGKERTLDEM